MSCGTASHYPKTASPFRGIALIGTRFAKLAQTEICHTKLTPQGNHVAQWCRLMVYRQMSMRGNSNNLAIMIVLNIVGVMLVLGAVILVLRGLGWVTQIPEYVIWALLLLSLGIGILGGIRSAR